MSTTQCLRRYLPSFVFVYFISYDLHIAHSQLTKLDIAASISHFASAKATSLKEGQFTAVSKDKSFDYRSKDSETEKQREIAENIGKNAIFNGEVAAVIMSGGQGTRLGFDGPKGKFNMDLISGSTIFQIHIERILKIRELCNAHRVQNNTASDSGTNHCLFLFFNHR